MACARRCAHDTCIDTGDGVKHGQRLRRAGAGCLSEVCYCVFALRKAAPKLLALYAVLAAIAAALSCTLNPQPEPPGGNVGAGGSQAGGAPGSGGAIMTAGSAGTGAFGGYSGAVGAGGFPIPEDASSGGADAGPEVDAAADVDAGVDADGGADADAGADVLSVDGGDSGFEAEAGSD
jgi:hypothetical protein